MTEIEQLQAKNAAQETIAELSRNEHDKLWVFTDDQYTEMKDQLAKAEQLWQVAQGRCDGLEEKLATAEQRVAEACAKVCGEIAEKPAHLGATDCEAAIDNSEWRKFVKEV